MVVRHKPQLLLFRVLSCLINLLEKREHVLPRAGCQWRDRDELFPPAWDSDTSSSSPADDEDEQYLIPTVSGKYHV